jgi:anti-anti-sigma regulatory factor
VTITTGLSGGRADPAAADHPSNAPDTAALTDSTAVSMRTGQVGLLSVTGRLDGTGLTQLRRQLQALLTTDARYLVVNLAGVSSCDYRLFDVLTRTHQVLTDRHGWMRLVGVGPAVRNALDDATPSECIFVYQASDWTQCHVA